MLNKEQKESIGLLSIGTFLEYFDLMLYVHLSVLLNKLFFPQFNNDNASLLSAFAFCAAFIFRPIGALILGYIGDNLGRKTTVIITTFMMSLSCLLMANLPTYAQIGVSASWIFTICRILQSCSSTSEIVGAEIYLTETIKRPAQFQAVALISFAATIGGTFALSISCLTNFLEFNWRIAFWVGAIIAIIGVVARTRLRETHSFVHFKTYATTYLEEVDRDPQYIKNILNYPTFQEKVNKTTILAYFLMHCGWPICFYLAYIYCGTILRSSFNYSPIDIIYQSFLLGIINLVGDVIFKIYLSSKIHPLKILKMMFVIFSIFIMFLPYLLYNVRSPLELLLIQSCLVIFSLDLSPARSILYSHFPIFKRFTYTSFLYALSRTLVYIITSFGLLYLSKYIGHFGILVIIIPILIGHKFGLSYFEKIEIKTGTYNL